MSDLDRLVHMCADHYTPEQIVAEIEKVVRRGN